MRRRSLALVCVLLLAVVGGGRSMKAASGQKKEVLDVMGGVIFQISK